MITIKHTVLSDDYRDGMDETIRTINMLNNVKAYKPDNTIATICIDLPDDTNLSYILALGWLIGYTERSINKINP
jgi:hypothetical protein